MVTSHPKDYKQLALALLEHFDKVTHGSDEMVKLYTHLRPEYRKRVLSTIPSLIRNSRTENLVEFHPVHPESEEIFAEQVV